MKYAIAVIDIGMTNKKIVIYNDSLEQLDIRYKTFKPKIIDNLETHDLQGMETWFIAELKALAEKYPIKVLAVSTHGGTFVCLGEDGRIVLPSVYYTHEPGEQFHHNFYKLFGDVDELQLRTGTPVFMAMISTAKGIFFVQEKFKEEYKNVRNILLYPQYWGFRFTGKMGIESTYIGNHTYLWDQVDNRFSTVTRKLAADTLMPETLGSPLDVLGTISAEFQEKTGLSGDTIVTLGIHDSNSALLPHFAKKGEKGFILNSTGTWCVIMNPAEKYGFSKSELGKTVLFNISAFGKPIKTANFMGGMQFEAWSQLFMKQHGRNDFPVWNEELFHTILKEKKLFLLPEIMPGSGQFPFSKARVIENGKPYFFDAQDSLPSCFTDYEKSYAVLHLSLIMQTLTAMDRAGIKDGDEVYTEGGFRKDETYNRLLASALWNNRVFITDIAEATALGTAMTAKLALSGKSLADPKSQLADLAVDFEICYQEQEKTFFPELSAYRAAWLAEAEEKVDKRSGYSP